MQGTEEIARTHAEADPSRESPRLHAAIFDDPERIREEDDLKKNLQGQTGLLMSTVRRYCIVNKATHLAQWNTALQYGARFEFRPRRVTVNRFSRQADPHANRGFLELKEIVTFGDYAAPQVH